MRTWRKRNLRATESGPVGRFIRDGPTFYAKFGLFESEISVCINPIDYDDFGWHEMREI